MSILIWAQTQVRPPNTHTALPSNASARIIPIRAHTWVRPNERLA
jgi:hypothetical protein